MDLPDPQRRERGWRLGAYEVVRQLARGGMAELLLARDASGLVVIKQILPRLARHPRYLRQFLDEAQLAATLVHPSIVRVIDRGEHAGQPYFAMEYVHGQDVRAILHRTWTGDAALPAAHAAHIGARVASALHHAHEQRRGDGAVLGVVHRDVSPSNILVGYDGTVKLVDFGVAKATTSTETTRAGTLKGKLSYMSPEQASGGPIDRRSDVFSLGIVLWEMVTTQRLFRGENDLQTLQLVIHQPARRPSEVQPRCPPALDHVILRALAKDPGARYHTADELEHELDSLGLASSQAELARHVNALFAAEVRAWREAEAAGGTLAQHLAHAHDLTVPLTTSDFIDAIDLAALASADPEADPDRELDDEGAQRPERPERGDIPRERSTGAAASPRSHPRRGSHTDALTAETRAADEDTRSVVGRGAAEELTGDLLARATIDDSVDAPLDSASGSEVVEDEDTVYAAQRTTQSALDAAAHEEDPLGAPDSGAARGAGALDRGGRAVVAELARHDDGGDVVAEAEADPAAGPDDPPDEDELGDEGEDTEYAAPPPDLADASALLAVGAFSVETPVPSLVRKPDAARASRPGRAARPSPRARASPRGDARYLSSSEGNVRAEAVDARARVAPAADPILDSASFEPSIETLSSTIAVPAPPPPVAIRPPPVIAAAPRASVAVASPRPLPASASPAASRPPWSFPGSGAAAPDGASAATAAPGPAGGALDPRVADRLLRRGLWVTLAIFAIVVALAIALGGGAPQRAALPAPASAAPAPP